MGSFFSNIGAAIHGSHPGSFLSPENVPGSPFYRGPGVAPGTSGAYSGVAPSLAGANAGYGGAVQPGANPYAAASAVNPYAYAASQATKSTGS